MSDKLTVFRHEALKRDYTVIPLSDIIGNKDYSYTLYADNIAAHGGRVRIIVATPK